jgi:hypothetical protein
MNAGDFFNIYAGIVATDSNNFSSVCEVSFIAIGAR